MAYQIGDVVAPFTLPRADGGELTVDPRAGTATVVVFTANHCPYALAWHARIDAVTGDYADRGVNVVQINANDESRYPADSTQASGERVARGEFSGPYLRDLTQEVAHAFGATRTPDVYVLDPTGSVAYHGAPDASYEDESENARYLRAALDDVLAGRAVGLAETPPVGCTIKWFVDAPDSVSSQSA
jgi:peroxiredoxin